MKNKPDVIVGIVMMLLSLVGFWGLPDSSLGGTDYLGPASFPRAVLILLFIISAALTIQGFFVQGVKKVFWSTPEVRKKVIIFFVWFLVYIALVILLGNFFVSTEVDLLQNNCGFMLGTFIFLIGALHIAGRKSKIEILVVSILVPIIIITTFARFFNILMP